MPQPAQVYPEQGRFARRLAKAASNKGLIARGDSTLVSVSGGPDSVALLSVLNQLAPRLQLRLHVVHFNHGLRGDESDGDERFVAQLCERMNLPFQVHHFHVAELQLAGRSLQEVARERRYAALTALAADLKVNSVALGHTADDQAETVLMWMLRGAGTSALGGIPPRRGLFIRPLLSITRADVFAYLAEVQLSYRVDSSNMSSKYFRNRLRYELLPALTQLRPAVVPLLGRQAEIVREDDYCLEAWASEEIHTLARQRSPEEWDLQRTGFVTLPCAIQRRVLRQLLRRVKETSQGPRFQTIDTVLERILHGRQGSVLVVEGVRVSRAAEVIRFEKAEKSRPSDAGRISFPAMVLSVPGALPSAVLWPPTGQIISFQEEREGRHSRGTATPMCAWLDADRFTRELQLRTWRPGDRFQPLGMHGRCKKLKEFFIDAKVPRDIRGSVPLLVAPEGILWVVGYRVDERFKVRASSQRSLVVRLVDVPHSG